MTSGKGRITANPAAATDGTDPEDGDQSGESDCTDAKWRIDGQRGNYAVIEADYHFEHNGKTEIDCICVASPTAAIHTEVSGAVVRYGCVGCVDQRLLLEGEAAPEYCMSHECSLVQTMIAAHRRVGDAGWRTRPYRGTGLAARKQITYCAFGGHRMCNVGDSRKRTARSYQCTTAGHMS